MISLERVRLVGWHFFDDVLVNLGNSCLLTGDNAAGKSTIVDAIQYALAADLRKTRFNAAAGERRGGRDLASYVRCKLGSDATEYLRGDAVAHVILEFSSGPERFLAGACVEAWADGRSPSDRFWICPALGADAVEVRGDDGRPLSYRQFRDRILPRGATAFDSATQYRRDLTFRLGVFRPKASFNPYLETFTRSVSFSPLVSVDKFVCDYILEEQPLRVEDMKANLESYKSAEAQAHQTKRRIASLREVMAAAGEYQNYQRILRQQDYLKLLVELRLEEEETELRRARQAALGAAIGALEAQALAEAERKATLEAARREAEAALARDDSHLLYTRLRERLEETLSRLTAARARASRCASLRAQCAALIGSPAPDPDADPEPEMARLEEERGAAERELDRQRKAQAQADSSLQEALAELAEIELGIHRFPEAPVALREALKARGIDAWLLSELAEVKAGEWTNAVEGWLGVLRFAVIVAPEAFPEALRVYGSLPPSVSGVPLPDISRMRDAAVRPGSLAELVSAESPWARAFLDFSLGEVMTADGEGLRKQPRAVTKDCMAYERHTATRIPEEAYARPWLGRSAREARKAFLAGESSRLRMLSDDAAAAVAAAEERLDILKHAVRSMAEAMGLFPSLAEAAGLSSAEDELRNGIEGIDTSAFRGLEQKIEELAARIREAEKARDERSRETARKEKELEDLRARALQGEERLSALRASFEGFLRENAQIVPDCERYAAERLRASSPREIADNYPSARKGLETKRDKALQEFRRLVQRYDHDYNALIPAEVEEIPAVSALLERLESSELPEYLDRISKARRDAELEFKDHFIARLNELIEGARESFREINDTLKSMAFGQNQYRFSLEERPDRRGQIEIVRKTAQITAFEGGLFDQLVDPAERQAAERLFDRILSSPLDSPELRTICDYRSYFSYDIRMKDLQSMDPSTGKAVELSLSKVLREKSGGEAQTPYYVAIAASFYRFFKDKPDSTVRLVLFDEAFDKLDDERIGKILQFYRQMGLQTIIAVPPDKLESIAPHMERVNLVIRHGQAATVRDYRKLEAPA